MDSLTEVKTVEKRFPEKIVIPVSQELYWQIFREMNADNPSRCFQDNRVTGHNLILLKLVQRNVNIVIQCEELYAESPKDIPSFFDLIPNNGIKKV